MRRSGDAYNEVGERHSTTGRSRGKKISRNLGLVQELGGVLRRILLDCAVHLEAAILVIKNWQDCALMLGRTDQSGPFRYGLAHVRCVSTAVLPVLSAIPPTRSAGIVLSSILLSALVEEPCWHGWITLLHPRFHLALISRHVFLGEDVSVRNFEVCDVQIVLGGYILAIDRVLLQKQLELPCVSNSVSPSLPSSR